MYFYQYHPSSRYQKQSHRQQKEIIYATWGTKGCRASSAAITVLYYMFIFPTGAISQIKLAICRTKKDVKFCFLPLCKYHRPFVRNLSPRTTKEDKTRVYLIYVTA